MRIGAGMGLMGRGAVLLLLAQAAWGQDGQRWITDQLEVDLRRGQSNRHAITRMVPSGTAVQVVETDKASGYSRIRTPSGAEGWLLTRYLMAQPPARVRLPELETRANAFDSVTRERDELKRQVAVLEASGRSVEQQLVEARNLSADTAKIAEQNRSLLSKLAAAEKQLAEVEARNRALSDKGRRDWFIAGAGVLGTGLALGLILPRIRWKKKSSWDRL